MQTTKTITTGWLLAVLLCFGLVSARAQNITNNDAGLNLNLGGEWVGGTAPGSGNVAVWNNLAQVNTTETLGANLSWAGIQILDPATNITIINDGNSLTLGASGIDMSLATNGLSLSNSVVLGGGQTWNVAAGQTLTTAFASTPGLVTGTGPLTLNGNGTVILGGTNTYSVGTVVNAGVLLLANGVTNGLKVVAGPVGHGPLTMNNGTTLRFGASVDVPNDFTNVGTVTIDLNNVGTSMLMNGSWHGSGTVIITNGASGSTFTIGGNGDIGTGSLNDYYGTIIMAGTTSLGNLQTNNLRFNDSGGNINLGSPNVTIDLGSGTNYLTTRNRSGSIISIGELRGAPNSAVKIGSSGSSGTTYSVGALNTSSTFGGIFDGVGTTSGEFLALTKVGIGTFTLTGPNSYNGVTTISAGTLQIGNGGTSGQLGTGSVLDNAALVFNRSDNITVTNSVSGSGTLTKVGANTLTYDVGTDSSSGATIISQGTLALGPAGLMSCPIFVASGAVYDVTANSAYVLDSPLSGFGTVNGLLTAGTGGTISPGGSGAAGTLNFATGLTENGNVNNQMELSSPGNTNDLINITGNLSLSGVNNITLSEFGGGTISNGTYTLMTYSGSLNGSLANLAAIVIGNTATLTNPPNQIAVIIGPGVRPATNLTWVGDGGANNWDLTTSNWVNGATYFNFRAGDSVRFDQAGAANSTVNVGLTVAPASVVVSNTTSYTLTGSGSIGGSGGLVKTNSGTLNLLTVNGYTGPTVIGGGTLVVSTLADGASDSGIGAASSNPTNLVFFGTTLNYTGASAATDRGATLNGSGAVFDVVGGTTLTLNGTLTGLGALTLVDSGTLTLGVANTYTGGTVLSNGVLALGSNLANYNGAGGSGVGPTNEPITFYGGTLQLYGVGQSPGLNYNTLYNPLVVPAGQVGTLQMFPRGPVNTGAGAGLFSSLSGGGTLNLEVNYLRDALSGDWSAFTGLINVTELNGSGDEFRINNTYGYANAAIYLNNNVLMDISLTPGMTVNIGELGGTSYSEIGQGTLSVSGPTWCVGWRNTTNTFSGIIADDLNTPVLPTSIIKVGTGTWYLSGQNTYSGSTTISNGVLALTNNVDVGGDGTLGNCTNVFINAGAVLDVSGRSDGTMPLNSGQTMSGGGTIVGILNANANTGSTVAPGGGIAGGLGTLTVTGNINLGVSGTTWMKLNRAASPNSDRLVSSAGAISYGGTLVVTNIGAQLHVGDTFTLFSAATLNNATPFTLVLPDYYTWNTSQLAANGQISVTASSPPAITNVNFSGLLGGSITLNAAHGIANGPVSVLTSTNLSLPLSSWTVVTNVTFDGGGNLSQAIPVDPTLPHSFYLLQVQ
jgi:autotransporter-associated beta strand protein